MLYIGILHGPYLKPHGFLNYAPFWKANMTYYLMVMRLGHLGHPKATQLHYCGPATKGRISIFGLSRHSSILSTPKGCIWQTEHKFDFFGSHQTFPGAQQARTAPLARAKIAIFGLSRLNSILSTPKGCIWQAEDKFDLIESYQFFHDAQQASTAPQARAKIAIIR